MKLIPNRVLEIRRDVDPGDAARGTQRIAVRADSRQRERKKAGSSALLRVAREDRMGDIRETCSATCYGCDQVQAVMSQPEAPLCRTTVSFAPVSFIGLPFCLLVKSAGTTT